MCYFFSALSLGKRPGLLIICLAIIFISPVGRNLEILTQTADSVEVSLKKR